jgi:hypothetical protein
MEPIVRNRDYPGRLTGEQWQALPPDKRVALARRAQCDLLELFRFCPRKLCRRTQSCGGDPVACEEKFWMGGAKKSRKLRAEYARIGALPNA